MTSFNITKLSSNYEIKYLKEIDIPTILELCKTNPQYYNTCPPKPSKRTILKDMSALPPNTTSNDKHYIGFFKQNKLIAIMDLILNYPDSKTCFIGLFMMHNAYQGNGIGSKIIQQTLVYLKQFYSKIKLGYVNGNQQSKHFWIKNGFWENGKESQQPKYLIKMMEKDL